MQKSVRVNEGQLLYLALKARQENTSCGYLHKKSADTGKWQLRWFALYQNLLFYYENDSATRPSGVCLLEGCYCERIVIPATLKAIKGDAADNKQYCFAIYYRSEGQRQYDLRADTESECNVWIDAIQQASFSKVLEQKEQVEQKHLHLLQILDSERQAKWHYVQQTEELTDEVKKLKDELREFKKERKISNDKIEEENEELRKIKKVQSFFRGWLCRRRWKQIVDEYIRSDHAESMRKRNSIVFGMVECEEEYVKQLSTLVSVFLRPLRMAASSKKPPITHEDVNSIFLNSETLLFLHQIFLKGLMARMENWPTLVLGDLFDMLLPMLGIYQEYVRNHHYSLQVLAEYKQKPEFNQLLRRYEEKTICEGRTLDSFLTFPMHQIPRYIITIHELLAHTPHDHVERKSLEFAQSKLEELSQIMQDEVSETENIRKNLAIERMIVEGCDILLDVNQTFVRQGSLLQILQEKSKSGRGRLGSFSTTFKESKKDVVRQVFLFTNHMLLTTRASNGRLHLAKNTSNGAKFDLDKHCGKIPLIDCTLIEDPTSDVYHFDDDSSVDSSLTSSSGNLLSASLDQRVSVDYNGLDFRLIVDWKSGPPVSIALVASSLQEKAAWCSDISQCVENAHYNDLIRHQMNESFLLVPGLARSDPKLFRDDVDIKFSRTLNSCKVPQIRHASKDRLLDRLTDLRFLSIDFLNTFLLTYRVFTNSQAVLEALKRVYRNPECGNLEAQTLAAPSSEKLHRHSFDTSVLSSSSPPRQFSAAPPTDGKFLAKPQAEKMRRISTGCMKIEVGGEKLGTASHSSFSKYERGGSGSEDGVTTASGLLIPPKPKLAPIASCETLSDVCDAYTEDTDQSEGSDSPEDTYTSAITITTSTIPRLSRSHGCSPRNLMVTFGDLGGESSTDVVKFDDFDDDDDSPTTSGSTPQYDTTLTVPSIGLSTGGISSETLIGSSNGNYLSTGGATGLSTSTSSDTLVATSPRTSPIPLSTQLSAPSKQPTSSALKLFRSKKISAPPIKIPTSNQLDALALSPASSPKFRSSHGSGSGSSAMGILGGFSSPVIRRATSPSCGTASPPVLARPGSPSSPKLKRVPSPISYSFSSPNIITNKARTGKRGSNISEDTMSLTSTPRSSFASAEGSPPAAKAGTVVTSSRASKRRSSSSAATAAFAAATAGSAPNPSATKDQSGKPVARFHSAGPSDLKPAQMNKKRESVINTAATMRVLNVLRHWVSKHTQDFECDPELKAAVKDLLEEMVCNTHLLPAEHKAAASILRVLTKDDQEQSAVPKVDLDVLLAPPSQPSKDTFDTLSALDIAEQLTYLDHKIFMSIRSEELLCQAWMKPDKAGRAPHVLLVSKRFNEVSRLVVSEIVCRNQCQDRVACIEKWAAIADICRCMHNYNGVLQICAAFVNSSVYRLKKTWEKISKQTKQMIEKLQTLVSSESRFKNMRDALHRCDPPCIPYLGMYLTDLSFIEEGTPNVTDEKLVNFSKMRMIAHVIREIQHFQQMPYRIEHHKRVTNYLLDCTRLLGDDETYKASLEIEPRTARVSMSAPTH